MVKNRRPDKENGCCNANFLKYLVFIFNFVFYLAGLAILGVGLWTVFMKSHYVVLLATKTYTATAYMLILAGLLVIFVGIIGCVGVTRESRPCILAFTFCLLGIFLLEAVAGLLAYVYADRLDKELQTNFKNTLQSQYGVDGDVTEAGDLLHRQHGCCGSEGFTDWRLSAWYNRTNHLDNSSSVEIILKVPHVCCKTDNRDTCGSRDHPSNIYYDGCITVLRDEIKEHEIIIGATALGISAVQVFGMVISCCLYIRLKDRDETYGRRKSKRNYANSY